MADFRTPHGFVVAVAEIKAAGKPMRLYFAPEAYSCRAVPVGRRKPSGMVRVGTYDAAELGPELAAIMRLELGLAIERAEVPRGTSELSSRSMTYYKAHSTAGRRSV